MKNSKKTKVITGIGAAAILVSTTIGTIACSDALKNARVEYSEVQCDKAQIDIIPGIGQPQTAQFSAVFKDEAGEIVDGVKTI